MARNQRCLPKSVTVADISPQQFLVQLRLDQINRQFKILRRIYFCIFMSNNLLSVVELKLDFFLTYPSCREPMRLFGKRGWNVVGALIRSKLPHWSMEPLPRDAASSFSLVFFCGLSERSSHPHPLNPRMSPIIQPSERHSEPFPLVIIARQDKGGKK